MQRLFAATVALGCAAGLIGLAAPAQAAAVTAPSTLTAGHSLGVGQQLRSPSGHYAARVTSTGRLAVYRGTTVIWKTPVTNSHARMSLGATGNLTVGTRSSFWSSSTSGAGRTTLAMSDDGALELRSGGGLVWSSVVGNRCLASGMRVVVSLRSQFAWLCSGRNQVLTTHITSGASALGDATPTGTWRLQAKVRNTTLYPAGGGAYPVDYWMPYNGAYGMHDSPWQHFAYGSSLYKTHGSHGCVHFPHAAIEWMFGWARVGVTIVSIHS